MNSRQISTSIVLISMILPSLLQASQIGDARNEFWISGLGNVQVGNSPLNPHAAVDHRGREIYVWEDSTYNPTTQAANIVMRILNPEGTTVRGPVQINTFDAAAQRYPRVAVSADNSFLVTWESREVDLVRTVIRSQTFDADGDPIGVEQIVNNIPTGKPGGVYLDVVALMGGGYVVIWQSGPAGDDTGTSIQGRLMGADGVPTGVQFQVSTISGEFEGNGSMAALNDGGFVVAWTYTEVWARRFDSSGTPLTDRFKVNTPTARAETDTSIVRQADGRIAIVWRDAGDSTDPITSGIRGRVYSPTLSPLGSDFQINSLTAGQQGHPGVADYGENGFFVVWHSTTSVGDDIQPNSIQGRIVTGNEEFGSVQFQVNQWTPKSQASPAVGGRNGSIASVWTSQGTQDFATLLVIKSRSWSICGIYCDGFE